MDFRTRQAVSPSEISLAAGLSFALAHAAAVGVSLRFVRRIPPIIIHLLSAMVIGATLPAVLSIVSARFQIAMPFWPAASIFYGGVIAWLYAFSAVYKSISLGILLSLDAAPKRMTALEEVARNFVLPRFVERVDLLVADGLVSRSESGYVITAQGLEAVRRLRFIQRIFAVSGKGFYLTS
jgi:hypothetical protein